MTSSLRRFALGQHGLIVLLGSLSVALCLSCSGRAVDPDEGNDKPVTVVEKECQIDTSEELPNFVYEMPCLKDYEAMASEPLDSSVPGAVSVKLILDREDNNRLYYQNSSKYELHFDFVTENIEDPPTIQTFNDSTYYKSDRRFIVGAVSYYQAMKTWTLDLAPYDTASVEMIELLYDKVRDSSYFGEALNFRPTSSALEAKLAELPGDIRTITNDELYEGIDFQPLTLGTAIGKLRFVRARALETTYLDFQDIVVLDNVPNDISTVLGIITQEFQTPLSHINVLSQNRGTPNMGLRDAADNEELRALQDKWAKLTVTAFDWSIEEATEEEAAEFWKNVRPEPVDAPRIDETVTEIKDIEDIVPDAPTDTTLKAAIKSGIPAFGGKSSHYSVLTQIPGLPIHGAMGVPMFYYAQFLRENGFDDRIEAMLADDDFNDDPATRDAMLKDLRADFMKGEVNQDFQDLLASRIAEKFPDYPRVRFRSSTNGEDLDGFTGAGLYTSATADQNDWNQVLDAVREVWGSVWYYRAFEERRYRSIDPDAVCMSLLVTPAFPDEFANGVALTANPFDNMDPPIPAFYVNVQVGGNSVVQPDAGTTTDQYIYYYQMPNFPTAYLSSSNMVEEGEHVLTREQAHELGLALQLIHDRFSYAYGPAMGNNGWYAMDTEFKLDVTSPTDDSPKIWLKQARPHPGRGSAK